MNAMGGLLYLYSILLDGLLNRSVAALGRQVVVGVVLICNKDI